MKTTVEATRRVKPGWICQTGRISRVDFENAFDQGDVTGSHEAIRAALQLVRQKQVCLFWPLPSAACCQTRLWIAQGNLEAAETLLLRLPGAAASAGRNGSPIEILILQALAFAAQMLRCLEQALGAYGLHVPLRTAR